MALSFTIRQNASTLTYQVDAMYVNLRGETCTRSTEVSQYDLVNNGHSGVIEYVKKSLERQIAHELGEQAVEMQYSSPLAVCVDPCGDDGWATVSMNEPFFPLQTTSATASPYTNYYGARVYQVEHYHLAHTLQNVSGEGIVGGEREIEIEFPLGKRTLTLKKKYDGGRIKVSMEDIGEAIKQNADQFKFQIITKRAERRAEDLLRSMISEVDFRNYKQQGFFTVQQEGKLYRIYKDKSKWVDMWEAKQVNPEELIWQPKNRLCTHTESRELPDADEALSKLMLIRSNKIIEHANLHSIQGTRGLEMRPLRSESELILI